MAIDDYKVTDEITTIQSLDDRPTLGTTAALKKKFDDSPEVIRQAFNSAIDFIKTYYALKSELSDVSLGAIPDGTITIPKLDFDPATQTELDAVNTKVGYSVGDIVYTTANTARTGTIKANGAAISRTTYASLFAKVGTTFGAGDGSTTFNLPDLRGVHVRGWDDSRGYDTGRTFGSYQADDNKAHTHTGTIANAGSHSHTVKQWGGSVGSTNNNFYNTNGSAWQSTSVPTDIAPDHSHTLTINSTGSSEVTVKNVALLACIVY